MSDTNARVQQLYSSLHATPEVGLQEVRTAAFLADQLRHAGFQVQTGVGGTGVVGRLLGEKTGPTLALRADMDALQHTLDGQPCAIHSCGHDAHSAIVLCVAELAAQQRLASGSLKILFQPAEEILAGALAFVDAGVIADVDAIVGIHLRPEQEAKKGQATPALYHGASNHIKATLHGLAAHAARPHLGINAIDAAAAVVHAINAIHMNPVVPHSIKVTQLAAGGPATNVIPDKADLAIDVRAQDNRVMQDLLQKADAAITHAASSAGAKAVTHIGRGVPAAEYSQDLVQLAREAILAVLGQPGLLPPITTPGAEDFHFYIQRKPSIQAAYIGLGCDLTPGLHHPQMKFDVASLSHGVRILHYIVHKKLGLIDPARP